MMRNWTVLMDGGIFYRYSFISPEVLCACGPYASLDEDAAPNGHRIST
jgi:hypothetical protein